MLTCFFLAGTAILGGALFVATKVYFVISLLASPPSLSFCPGPVRHALGLSRRLQLAFVSC